MATFDAKPSHTDIASLESAFASDPTSKAYQPLAEAYLSLGRFMEAMVVCKKGVKAHPHDPEARVLLGRIYAEQSKDRKAQEELKAALDIEPGHVSANLMLGVMLLRKGEMDEGARYLKLAAETAPEDPEVLKACEKWGVEPPAPPPPPAQSTPDPQPSSAGQTFQGGIGAPPPPPVGHGALGSTGPAPGSGFATEALKTPPPQPQAGGLGPSPSAVGPASFQQDLGDSSLSMDDDPLPGRSRLPALITLGLLVVGALVLVGWWGMQARSATRVLEADERLAEAQRLLGQGSYSNYLKVAELAEDALEYQRRGTLGATANAYLAFVHALRWGEYYDGESHRQAAERHLEASEEHGANLTIRVVAQAYYDFFSGDTEDAVMRLRAYAEEEGSTAAVLLSALGHMYLWMGEHDEARRYLGRAREQAPRDAKIYVAMGEIARRQGDARLADRQFARALSFDEDHVDALLGQALIILDAPELGDEHAEQYIDRVLEVSEGQLAQSQRALAHLTRAQYHFAQGETEKGENEQEEALFFGRDNPDIHMMVGRRLLRQGDHEEAVASIRRGIDRAIENDANRPSFHLELARALLEMPDEDGAAEAVRVLEDARRSFPDNMNLMMMLGEAHMEANDADAALAVYREANEMQGGESTEAMLAMSNVLRRQRSFSAATKQLDELDELFERRNDDRGRARVAVERALMDAQQNNRSSAIDTLMQAIDIDQGYADAYFHLGRLLARERRRRGAAKQVLEAYVELAPDGRYGAEAERLLQRL